MPTCSNCKQDVTPQALIGGVGKLICENCYGKEKAMCTSFKNGFEFVVEYSEEFGLTLKRKYGKKCYCPFNSEETCGSWCPHFVVENCSIVDKKCNLILTCGKHLSRIVEIL